MIEDFETLTEEQLEELLLQATSEDMSGRRALARVTALRTILKRREQRPAGEEEADARRALALVNATRGPGAQLTEIHPAWVGSILAEPGWAALYASDEEMRRASERRARLINETPTEGAPDG